MNEFLSINFLLQATAISSESEGEDDSNQLPVNAYTSNISHDIPRDEVEHPAYNRKISQDGADDNSKKDSAVSDDGEIDDLEDGIFLRFIA